MVSTYNPNPPGNGNTRWWLEDWTGGSGRDYQNQSFEEAYREFLRQSQQPPQPQPPPQQPNEGQIVNQPQNPTGTAQDPVFSTDVWGNNQPLQTIGSNIGDPTLNQYLSSLPQGQGGTGGGGYQSPGSYGDFSFDPNPPPSTFYGEGTAYPFPGEYPVEKYDPNPPPGTRGNAYTYFSDPSVKGNPTFEAEGTYKPPPDIVGWPEFKFTPNPPPKPPPDIHGPVLWPTLDDLKFPPPPPPQQQQQQQQQQQPGVGPLLAALPMLAAFQGGTTTTPAPYAHLGPHTPVAPVFQPQGPGKPIPSIGQLLAGVK